MDDRLARVRFRRALTLLAITLLLPGSAQLVAGRKRVGRVAIRISLGLVAVLGVVIALGLIWPGLIYWLLSNTFMLGLVRLVLFGVAIGWAGPVSYTHLRAHE